jgi:site-specific DNA-methyltransferase (adenine-specific)
MEGTNVSKPTVRLIHGDCLEVLKTLDAGSVDAVITDPPYLVAYKGRRGSKTKVIAGDTEGSWVQTVYAELFRVLKDNSFCVSFYGWPQADVFMSVWKNLGFRPVSHLVFVKNVWGLGHFTRGQHEVAVLLAKGKPKRLRAAVSDVFPWKRVTGAVHQNQKPDAVMSRLVENYSPAGGTVLDPYMGSGTTGVACVKAGLNFIGVEIDPTYFATAERRIYEANDTLPLAG